jgi:hypothetical protein
VRRLAIVHLPVSSGVGRDEIRLRVDRVADLGLVGVVVGHLLCPDGQLMPHVGAPDGVPADKTLAVAGLSAPEGGLVVEFSGAGGDLFRCDHRRLTVLRRSRIGYGSSNNIITQNEYNCKMVEVLRRYSNRPDLLGPMIEVLRRIATGDQSDEPGAVASREGGTMRPSDRLSESDVHGIVARFRTGTAKHRLATEYCVSLSSVKRLLRKYG